MTSSFLLCLSTREVAVQVPRGEEDVWRRYYEPFRLMAFDRPSEGGGAEEEEEEAQPHDTTPVIFIPGHMGR